MSAPRGIALTTVLALVLAMASAFFAVRAIRHDDGPRVLQGTFHADDVVRARALVARLARGLLKLQQPDGGFHLGVDSEGTYFIERVAGSALATVALARTQKLAPEVQVEGLAAALDRGLDYIKKLQTEAGAIGNEEPNDRWSQVDATSAGLLALVLAGREQDEEARIGAAKALRRFARAGLRNGWTRALGTMAVDRISGLERGDLFDGNPRGIADIRDLKQAREGPLQTSDWNVAEGLSRVVLGIRKGADPFPARLVLAILDDPPTWSGPSADCQAFWMQAWLVARSGAPRARAWFGDLLEAYEGEAVEDDDTIHGGWYANSLSQTAGAVLSLIEGLTSQVVILEGVGDVTPPSEESAEGDAKR